MSAITRLHNQHFIGGKWVDSHSQRRFTVINPATEESLTEMARGDGADVDAAVHAAAEALDLWRAVHPSERGRLLFKLAAAVIGHTAELAELETLEMGRPLQQSIGGMKGVIDTIEYNAGAADKLHGETIPIGPDHLDFTWLEPLGVTAHIIPWNAPLGMTVRSMAPALAAGCTVVIKPAEQSPLSTLRLAEIAQSVGFPDGVINVVNGFGEEVGEALIRHPLVRGVTFTGSVETGKRVMALAAPGIKPVVLELGGKNPLIVFADADLDWAVDTAARGILTNCGQVCVAASRLLIQRDVYDSFVERLRARFASVTVGDPFSNPDLGPLVSREQHERVTGYLKAGRNEGARVVIGGGTPAEPSRGFYVEPTIFGDVQPEMRIAREEIFGPVVTVTAFESEAEALSIANGSAFGLAAGVFTQDISRALRVTRGLQAGILWVNDWFAGGAIAPVGGYKESGLGRERGMAGLYNYVQRKNVAIRI
jgi:aldehyde dehydrogenase (NAD+)